MNSRFYVFPRTDFTEIAIENLKPGDKLALNNTTGSLYGVIPIEDVFPPYSGSDEFTVCYTLPLGAALESAENKLVSINEQHEISITQFIKSKKQVLILQNKATNEQEECCEQIEVSIQQACGVLPQERR